MPLTPITPPPGFYRNATPFTRRQRWEEGNLVRWKDGSMRPIGGWTERITFSGSPIGPLIADPTLEAIRDIYAWKNNVQTPQLVFGSNLALYHVSSTGVVTDITYTGYAPLNPDKDATGQSGYGQNPYGVGPYGVSNNLSGDLLNPPDRWYFTNFGEILLAGVINNGDIYELDLSTLTMSAVSTAPTNNSDVVVTDQRQVFVVGANGEPRRIQASEIEDRTVWTPARANQAVDITIPGTGRLIRCMNVLRQILILGENDAHVARYIGPPYVYSIDLAGEQCGPLAAQAATKTDRFAVWWGSRGFWLFDGTLQKLDCEVIDFVYKDIDPDQASKISSFTNTDFSEIWWLYQSLSSTTTEVDSYVVWNYRQNAWYTGRIDRTAGLDKGVPTTMLMVAPDGIIYNHELEGVYPDGDVHAITGPLLVGTGEQNLAIRYIYPDTITGNNITVTLKGKAMPNAQEFDYGPYPLNNPITTRAMGRSIRMRVDFDDASAQWGDCRIDFAPVGTGRR